MRLSTLLTMLFGILLSVTLCPASRAQGWEPGCPGWDLAWHSLEEPDSEWSAIPWITCWTSTGTLIEEIQSSSEASAYRLRWHGTDGTTRIVPVENAVLALGQVPGQGTPASFWTISIRDMQEIKLALYDPETFAIREESSWQPEDGSSLYADAYNVYAYSDTEGAMFVALMSFPEETAGTFMPHLTTILLPLDLTNGTFGTPIPMPFEVALPAEQLGELVYMTGQDSKQIDLRTGTVQVGPYFADPNLSMPGKPSPPVGPDEVAELNTSGNSFPPLRLRLQTTRARGLSDDEQERVDSIAAESLNGVYPLEGDLLQTLQAQPWHGDNSDGWSHGMQTIPLTGVGLLILQQLEQVPGAVTSSPEMLRIGILRPDATTVDWRGWVTPPVLMPPSNDTRRQYGVQLHRDGWILWLDQSGINPDESGWRDVRWTRLPPLTDVAVNEGTTQRAFGMGRIQLY